MAFERETRRQKLLKEKAVAKIQASQQATYDSQAAKDELNALRVRDQVCGYDRRCPVSIENGKKTNRWDGAFGSL